MSDGGAGDDLALPIAAAAAQLLNRQTGAKTTVIQAQCLTKPERRNTVVRLRLEGGGMVRSVIVKKIAAAGYQPADPANPETVRFLNDWAGLVFLHAVAPRAGHAPHFIAGDIDAGLIVLEDLGNGPSLVQALLHGTAEEAHMALLAYAARLGCLHADTIPVIRNFPSVLRGIHSAAVPPPPSGRLHGATFESVAAALAPFLPGLALPEDEIVSVLAALAAPGVFLAYLHGDPCPDNVLLVDGDLRPIDFEHARPGHALLDAVYGLMCFPSCWCAGAVPEATLQEMELAYRRELARAVPFAVEDAVFAPALVAACAGWLLQALVMMLPFAMQRDEVWGLSGYRARLLRYLERFTVTAGRRHQLPGLVNAAEHILAVLRTRWPDCALLPPYPAFLR